MNPIIERVFDAIVRIDSNKNIKFITDTGLRWFGGEIPVLSRSFKDLIVSEDYEIFEDVTLGNPSSFTCYLRLYTGNNVPTWVNLRGSLLKVINQYLICILDINDYSICNKALVYAAEHDSLTKLPNRAKLTKVVNEMVNSGKISFTLALMDLDGFKKVNDTLGHHAGDEVLIDTSNRLIKAINKDTDFCARLGGDEFVLVLDDANGEERIRTIMSRVLYLIARPYFLSGQDAYLGCSIGIANYPEHADTYTDLLKNADTAMYYSKRSGKNRVSTYVQAIEKEDFSIKSAIHIGIQEGEFYVVYQPLYNRHGKIKGAEALMRWNSSVLGAVPPDQFIAIAEETGLMTYLGEWILRAACYQLKVFHKYNPDFVVSVNVSPVQFSTDEFHQNVINILEETQVETKHVVLEITESTLLKSHEKIESVLNDLSDKGINLAIDDFGTGFSSLSYLTRLPVSLIKIDKSFITAIEHQPITHESNDKKLIKAMVSLAHSIELKCVAEGVENQMQLDYLKSIDCDFIQGYLLSKPLAPDDVIALLKGT